MFWSKKLLGICILGCLLLGLICIGSRSAWGHAFDNYGFGSRAISMGGAMVGMDNQYTAVYYNPAGISFNEEEALNIGANFLYSMPSIKIKSPSGSLIRDNFASSEGISAGLAAPLGSGRLGSVLSAGLGLYLPYPLTLYIINVKAFDPSDPFVIQYDNANNFPQITAALSFKAWKKLAFSVGTDILINLYPSTINLEMINNKAKIGLNAPFPMDFAPTAGIQYRPTDWLSLGAAYHGVTQVKISIDAKIDAGGIIPGFSTIPAKILLRDAYKPQQVEFGAGIKPLQKLLVALAVSWMQYSDYHPPVVKLDLTEAKNDPNLAGMVGLLEGFLPVYDEFKFNDYWIPRLGVEYNFTEHLDGRLGYSYRNSAVPKQDSLNTCFIDPPLHNIGAGISIKFFDPLNIIENPINVDFAYQGQFMQKVSVRKADATKSYNAEGINHVVNGTLMYNF